MKKSFVISILFFIICFLIIGCNNNPEPEIPPSTTSSPIKPVDTPPEEKKDNFPKLEIINKGQITITSVSLEGYSFSNLSIKQNQSKIFELKDGMPTGYKDVRVSIRYRPYRVSNDPTPPIIDYLDFADGVTTSWEIHYRILLR